MATRLDTYLVNTAAFPSRVKAKEAILEGRVSVNGSICRTPAKAIGDLDRVEITATASPAFASHGGEKLEKAITEFALSFAQLRVLDIGASTGGFTECALRHGAAHVYAIDVGHDQLLPSLRTDPRVSSFEGLNIRALQLSHLDGTPVDAIVCDVSFISLSFVIPTLPRFLNDQGWAVLLVKPQFEVGPSKIRRGGLANSPADHHEVLQRIISQAESLNLAPLRLTYSPRLAPQKNIEYLLLLSRQPHLNPQPIDIDGTIRGAFAAWRKS